MTEATLTPWAINMQYRSVRIYGPKSEVIAVMGNWSLEQRPELDANAALIVRAVNSHDALVSALEAVVPILPGYVIDLRSDGLETFGAKVDGIAIQARAALALAKGDAA